MLINQFLEESAQQFPNKIALIYKNRRLTYTEIESMSNSLAHALIDHGVEKQDRGAILLENSVESVISLFGILKTSAYKCKKSEIYFK
jgi:long-chain acyl-CoA synthetase